MTKLPINLLLTVVIVALLGAIGLQFKKLMEDQQRLAPDQNATQKTLSARIEAGQLSAGQTVVGPDYSQPRRFWDALAEANLNGEEPPEPEIDTPDDDVETAEPETPQVPLEDIMVLVCIVAAGDDSRVLIAYKPEANIEPPEDVVPSAPNAGVRGDTVPARTGSGGSSGNRNRAANNPFPTAPGSGHYTQQLEVGDSLWGPYDNIELAGVVPYPSHAVFLRKDPDVPEEEWSEEPLYPEALGLDQDVLAQLGEGVQGQRQRQSAEREREPVQTTDWTPTERTVEVSRNRFNVGSRDRTRFRRDPDIFSQDIGTRSWRSTYDDRRGVQITNLSPELTGYGVQEGDVIVAINGESVRNKAEAIRVGKRLYKRGVRRFEVEFIGANGRSVTRTYVLPDE